MILIKGLTAAMRCIATLAALAFATAASAGTVIITDVGTGYSYNGGIVTIGSETPWTTPILLTDGNNKTLVVFCYDLQHYIYVGGGQHLVFTTGPVKYDGNGDPISEATSNVMGQIANLGRHDYFHGNEDGAIAAQAAIWSVEYGAPVSSTDPTVESYITKYLKITDNGRGYAFGIQSANGVQNQILGGVPEPSTWAMMLFGVGALGLALRLRRRTNSAVATAA